MGETTEAIIKRAISEANAGNKEAAKKSFSQVVRLEPNNARAWYLLSQVVEKPEQAIYCLEKVLRIDPDNQQAKERLKKLRPKTEQVFEELPHPDKLEISAPLAQDATIAIKRTPKQKEYLYLILGLTTVLVICFVGAITFWLNNEKARNKPAVIPVMPTPTIAIDNYKWIVYEIIYTQKRWVLADWDLSAGKSILT